MVRTRSESMKDDANLLLSHIRFPAKSVDYRALFDENDQEKHMFIKLLEAINMRASELSKVQPDFPRMDVSALYCLGITIQEYIRHLSTDILTQKRAAENKPPIGNMFTIDDVKSRTLEAVIQKFIPQTSSVVHANSNPAFTPLPDIKQDVYYSTRSHRTTLSDRTDGKSHKPPACAASKERRRLKKMYGPVVVEGEATATATAPTEAAFTAPMHKLQDKTPRKRVNDTRRDIFDKSPKKIKKKAKKPFVKNNPNVRSSQQGF